MIPQVGHYLWGIDTVTLERLKLNFSVSDITYEELTLLAYFSMTSCTSCRTLPMRNWHKLTYLVIDSQRTLVGHYLWGIDTFNPMVANCKTTRSRILSDITYEELTQTFQLSNALISCKDVQSDITYEELTQTFQLSNALISCKDVQSDITYEELTHSYW